MLQVMHVCCLQDVNTKAEAKFSKLKMQAKGKIASLQAELDKYKMDQSASSDTANTVGGCFVFYLPQFSPCNVEFK